ncbi:hypothetical protein BDQ17DRAFT_883267 [Cyathus striatus]|nr:hypothetical protein BDQ17DRAFT_883267 [Cyathus striatus]
MMFRLGMHGCSHDYTLPSTTTLWPVYHIPIHEGKCFTITILLDNTNDWQLWILPESCIRSLKHNDCEASLRYLVHHRTSATVPSLPFSSAHCFSTTILSLFFLVPRPFFISYTHITRNMKNCHVTLIYTSPTSPYVLLPLLLPRHPQVPQIRARKL